MSGFQFNQDWAFKIAFQRTDDPEPIGVLDLSGPEMTFTGRADESAKAFFDAVIKNQVGWNKHLEDVRRELERELVAMREQRDEARGQTLYLLYDGTSVDGRGEGKYIGRTTDKEVARNHHAKCRKNPYSIGFVEIVTDTEKKQVSYYGRELQPEKEEGGA